VPRRGALPTGPAIDKPRPACFISGVGYDLVVLGHVTRDLIAGKAEAGRDGDPAAPASRWGGAAGFAARAGARLGLRTALLTAARPDDPTLADLAHWPNLDVEVVPSQKMTTFELDYRGPRRRVFLRARAPALTAQDVPASFRQARVVYLGPVAAEVRPGLGRALWPQAFVAAGLQGWLRRFAPDGLAEPAPRGDWEAELGGLDLGILSEEDHPLGADIGRDLERRGVAVALTAGARGADLWIAGQQVTVPAAPAAEVDPTGAGDVFGVVLACGLAAGEPAAQAAGRAAWAAARVVEGPGLGTLPEVAWKDCPTDAMLAR